MSCKGGNLTRYQFFAIPEKTLKLMGLMGAFPKICPGTTIRASSVVVNPQTRASKCSLCGVEGTGPQIALHIGACFQRVEVCSCTPRDTAA